VSPVAAASDRLPRCPADALRELVAAVFGLPPAALSASSRGDAEIAFARQTAMYLAHVACGASYSDIGRAFGRDRTTAAHACRVVEERRDDPRVEAVVQRLERLLAAEVRRAGEGRWA
jgi:chromosomal replication initiation ATPase DnaA